jgi:DNA-binding CsgD family transcriptional regulator
MVGCTQESDKLKQAEQLMVQHHDSALMLLQSIHPSQFIRSSDKALYSLLLSQAYDRNEIYITSDSIISVATQYYGNENPDRAGSAWFYSSRCAKNRGNTETQAAALLKAQEFAGLTTNHKLRALIHCDKADMYKVQQQYDSSLILNKKGLQEFFKANDLYNVCLTAITLGLQYSSLNCTDSSKHYLLYAEKVAKSINAHKLFSSIYKGLGNCEIHLNDYRKALKYYKMAPKTENLVYDENQLYLISNIYLLMGKTDSADYFIRKVKCPESMTVAYYMLRKQLCEKQNDVQQSLYYANQLLIAKDSFYTHSLKTSFAGMERRFKYDRLNDQNNELKIESDGKTSIILVISLLVSIGIIGFMYWSLRIYKRKLEMERELNEKEKDLLQKATENNGLLERQLEIERQLNIKEKDLREKVVENNELLQMQNNLQTHLLQYIDQYKLNAGKGNLNISTKLDDDKIKEEIIFYVDTKYNDVSRRLKKQYYLLNDIEIYVCCMLLAGFNTGMIATILSYKNDSVNTQRTRLRKKFQLENNENLIDFLCNL